MKFPLGPAILFTLALLLPADIRAQEEFTFELGSFEKKKLEWGGYLELKGERIDVNESGASSRLNYQKPHSKIERIGATLELDGRYRLGGTTANWLLRSSASQDNLGWHDSVDIYSAYATFTPSPLLTLDLGKKSFKWGKGYAFNPAGLINRPKDPTDPEESMEGYVAASLDLVKSFNSEALKTVAFTTALIPVWQGVNKDFGNRNELNLAAKLYLLLFDTDIDLTLFTGGSRNTAYALDFSRNLATNLEIHGEIAHTPNHSIRLLEADNSVSSREVSDTSWLLGLRYLSHRELTTIVEYYHNGDGYSQKEMARFFRLVDQGYQQYESSGTTTLLDRAGEFSKLYSRPQAGRNYLYLRLSQKEPFNLLYFTPSLTTIVNLDDQSWSLSPEAVYSGFTNWELRLRLTALNGGFKSEYGNKLNDTKAEARIRYFF